jgi:hypothetical protein
MRDLQYGQRFVETFSLLNGNMARSVWALFDDDLTEHLVSNQNDDAKVWISGCLKL